MSFLLISDCSRDSKLAKLVTQVDIDESDIYFKNLCNELGVYIAQIKTDPLPIESRRVILFWIYCEVCGRNIGENINITADGYKTDWYKDKLEYYKGKLAEALAELTPNKIMGIAIDNIEDNSHSPKSNLMERA